MPQMHLGHRITGRKDVSEKQPSAPEATRTWLWVAKPEVYLDDYGQERSDLEPASQDGPAGWWTCHKETRTGDLALIYRAGLMKDIAYLARAESDAYEPTVASTYGKNSWVCDYVVLQKFDTPLPIAEMRADPVLASWAALKKSFIGATHAIPTPVWTRLLERIEPHPGTVRRAVERYLEAVEDERALRRFLVAHPEAWEQAGHSLSFVAEEKTFQSDRTRADLVYLDPSGAHVVVELKYGSVGPRAVAQLLTYMSHASHELSKGRDVRGILVGTTLDKFMPALLARVPDVEFISLDRLGISQNQPVAGAPRRGVGATAPTRRP